MSRRSCRLRVGLVFLACAAVAAAAVAGSAEYQRAQGGFAVILDEPCPARDLPDPVIGFFSPDFAIPGGSESVQCVTTARDGGEVARRGVQVTLEGEIFDLDGNPIRTLSRRTRTLNPYGRFSWPYSAGPGGALVAIQGSVGGDRLVDQLQVDCRGQSRVPCVVGENTSCVFGNGRFKVEVDWNPGTGLEPAGLRRISGTASEFFFFSPGSTDLVVELLNRCTANDHFWVFYAATTDVEFRLGITDTQSGATRSFRNPAGTPAAAVLDTSAFATCP